MSKKQNGVLRIVYLEAENVKRLKAVRLRPDKTLVRIEGKNAAGKTSVLDAISAALGGGKEQPTLPVRSGAKRARVELDLDEIKVERRWTAGGGTSLVVTAKDGTRLASPQAILDQLVADCTFDPLAFVRAKPPEQEAILKRLAGLDWTALDDERREKFAERTNVNREVKAAAARVGQAIAHPANMEPIDLTTIADKQRQAMEHNQAIEAAHRDASEFEQLALGAAKDVRDLQDRLDKAKNTLGCAKAEAAKARTKADAMEPVELGDIRAELEQATQHNDTLVAYDTYKERQATADEWATRADGLTNRIEEIDAEKAASLIAARFPLPGLGLDAQGVTLNDIPFSQASSAEQLRTGVAIGLAQKPRCRVILIRDGSLLDDSSLEALHKIAVEYDAQVFLERVADKASPSAVFIEDGEIVEPAEVATG
jgi:DNA repair exonuclease SbcCD ATPase subunit